MIDNSKMIEILLRNKDYLEGKEGGVKAVFAGMDLSGARITAKDIILNGVDFSGCDLTGAYFSEVRLTDCKFVGAKLDGARFEGCDIDDETLVSLHDSYRPMSVMCYFPDFNGLVWFKTYRYDLADFEKPIVWDSAERLVGYKIVDLCMCTSGFRYGHAIAELVIPPDAKKLLFKGGKCRADKAYVNRITGIGEGEGQEFPVAYSPICNTSTEYGLHEMVYADSWDESCLECSHGIHFFLTKEEALDFGRTQVR